MLSMFEPLVPPPPPPPDKRPVAARPGDDVIASTGRGRCGRRADCCVADASYRVVFRSAERHVPPLQLLLCGHHYRASTTTLLALNASVYDAGERLLATPA